MLYSSPEGHELVKTILCNNKTKPIEPHDYQVEGICKVLDGVDVLATMATGAGKTGLYSFLILVLIALSEDPSDSLDINTGDMKLDIPQNPAMLLIAPTKALELSMEENMIGFGVKALVINADAHIVARNEVDGSCQTPWYVALMGVEGRKSRRD